MNNTYFLLRHGRTIYQAEKTGLIYPWPEKPAVKLTEKGEEMIKSVAKVLKNKNINLIFSSAFFRTRQTAEIISKALGVKPIFDKRLVDVDFGIYNGGFVKDFDNAINSARNRFLIRPENGESRKDVKKRVKAVIEEIEKKYKNKNILIISHGDPLFMLEGIIKGLKTDEEFIEFTKKTQPPEVGELRKIN